MVLMQNPYKTDKQLEKELKEIEQGRVLIRRPCLSARLHENEVEQPLSFDQIRRPLFKRMIMQEAQIKYLLETVKNLETLNQNKELQPKIIVVEEISKDDGKKLVENYFEEHGCADIEELMVNLRIPVQTIVEIIDELRDEGKLTPKGEKET